MKHYKKRETKLQHLPKFTTEPKFSFIVPDDANELHFFKLFYTYELPESITLETNKQALEYLQKNKNRLKEHSDFKKWTENGINDNFGIVKDLLHYYWSADSVMSTLFPRSIMSRQDFLL